jgi:S-adenosylmethionine decarboxylase
MPKRASGAVQIATVASTSGTPAPNQATSRKDHFVYRDGQFYAGEHIIVDFHGAERLDDMALMETALRQAVVRAGATLLHLHLHRFTQNGGISGVAVLSESHISVHSWPEIGFAAFDVFMCGRASPDLAVQVLREHFRPARERLHRSYRGSVESDERLY